MQEEKGGLKSLTAADIALTAGLSVIIGVLFTFWSNVVANLAIATGPLGIPVIYGFWFLGGIIPAYIIRKPGVAFLGEFIAAHVELLTGSQYGVLLTYYGATQGLASEVVFAIFRYHKWDLKTLLLAGITPAIPAYLMDYIQYAYGTLPVILQVGNLVVMGISGAILGGVLGKYTSEAIARTGILLAFPLGKEIGAQETPET